MKWENRRKLAWIKMVLAKANALNTADGTTQMQNTMQGWLQQGQNATETVINSKNANNNMTGENPQDWMQQG